jgi:hypothetical protein
VSLLLPAGLPIAGRIHEPGFLEGGDFFPMGADLALVGVGLRSNVEACQQLMDRDLLGTRRLGVVRDDFDRDQVRRCGQLHANGLRHGLVVSHKAQAGLGVWLCGVCGVCWWWGW